MNPYRGLGIGNLSPASTVGTVHRVNKQRSKAVGDSSLAPEHNNPPMMETFNNGPMNPAPASTVSGDEECIPEVKGAGSSILGSSAAVGDRSLAPEHNNPPILETFRETHKYPVS